jgi:prophage regulatory protein
VNPSVRFLRLPQVCERRACSRPTLYRDVQAGIFPPPIKRGRRCSLWIEAEVDVVLAAEAAGAGAEELTRLVARLVVERGAAAQSGGVAAPPRDRIGRFASARADA